MSITISIGDKTYKVCQSCSTPLPISFFYKYQNSRLNSEISDSICKDCKSKQSKHFKGVNSYTYSRIKVAKHIEFVKSKRDVFLEIDKRFEELLEYL